MADGIAVSLVGGGMAAVTHRDKEAPSMAENTPPIDPRIPKYREAAARMKAGQFRVDIPVGVEDEIGELGRMLRDLGETLEHKFLELQQISRITAQINAGFLLDEVLDSVYATFHTVIPYDRIGFSLLDEECATLTARWAKSRAPTMLINSDYSAPLEGSSLRTVLETGQPRILNDLEDYLTEHPHSASTRLVVREGMRSSLTCPLIANRKPIGFMFFSSMQPGAYREEHVELFQAIAGQLAMIVEKGRLYQRLVELDELKSKFLGIVVHDLRNPLNVVKGYLGLMRAGTLNPTGEERDSIYGTMERACERMLDLMNDLLDIRAIESGRLDLEPRQVGIRPFLDGVLRENLVLGQAKEIALRVEIADGVDGAWFDPQRVSQVLENLITNAFKFSHGGTEVLVRAVPCPSGRVVVSVADHGQGIPSHEQTQLFSEFGQCSVRPTGGEKSHGLGLAICKRIVEAHGGRIWVKSRPGEGSTFGFTLPAHPAAEPGETVDEGDGADG